MKLSDPWIKDLFDFYSIKGTVMAGGPWIFDCPLRVQKRSSPVSTDAIILVLVKFIASFLSHRCYHLRRHQCGAYHGSPFAIYSLTRRGLGRVWTGAIHINSTDLILLLVINIFVLLFSSLLQEGNPRQRHHHRYVGIIILFSVSLLYSPDWLADSFGASQAGSHYISMMMLLWTMMMVRRHQSRF